MKILILKRDKIGDMLLTTPMLAHLRESFPSAQIDVLANSYNAWVIQGHPAVDHIHIYQRYREGKKISITALWSQLVCFLRIRKACYDYVIVAGGDFSHRALRRARLTGAKYQISFLEGEQGVRAPVTHPIPAISSQLHESQRMLMLLEPFGVKLPEVLLCPTFQLPTVWRSWTLKWLSENGLDEREYIVLGLGARRAKKQPSYDQIVRWTEHFYRKHRLKTIFMWTPGASNNPIYPGDDDIALPVVDAKMPWLIPFRGAILPAIGLIWSASTSIFPDSGLMHFAAASPGGVLGLFAETDVSPHPSQWGPVGANVSFLDTPKAVAELPDDDVYAKVDSLIAGRTKGS
ncbi:glycosyltransferase family 9 protein [Chrysiogenes arsenatis]|uniref:glycosyltransferase family 9 protein n=1 Tax=Chrysiogenes arsenatis TaxID=309797 RepID=UPI0003F9BF11|nr:glycosyltransferase family 9 protein [Chrysiogenes arsenatis]